MILKQLYGICTRPTLDLIFRPHTYIYFMSYLAQVLYIIDYLIAALDKNLDYIVVILSYHFRSGVYMLF